MGRLRYRRPPRPAPSSPPPAAPPPVVSLPPPRARAASKGLWGRGLLLPSPLLPPRPPSPRALRPFLPLPFHFFAVVHATGNARGQISWWSGLGGGGWEKGGRGTGRNFVLSALVAASLSGRDRTSPSGGVGRGGRAGGRSGGGGGGGKERGLWRVGGVASLGRGPCRGRRRA